MKHERAYTAIIRKSKLEYVAICLEMKLAERSLSGFLEVEPDIYKIEDLKVSYK